MPPIEIFIAYSHQDLKYKDELKKFLRPLLNTKQAVVWDDHDIEAGQDWEAEIKKRLYGAEILLLLVSPDSLASDYFYGREVAVSLERHERGEAVVVPVVLRPCAWTITPLKKIEALPTKGKPVTSWASQDEAFTEIANSVGELVENRQKLRAEKSEYEAAQQQFTAAVQAANHLFDQGRLAPARDAYTALLLLFRPGFLPDRKDVETRLADCEARLRQIAEAEARQREATDSLERAQQEQASRAQRAREAEQALQKAEKDRLQREQAAADLRETQRQREEANRLERAQKAADKQAAEEARRQEGAATSTDGAANTRTVLVSAGVVLGLLLLLLVWKPWKQGRGGTDGPPPSAQDLEKTDFENAKQANTLSALRRFVEKQYPKEQYEPEAKRILQQLNRQVEGFLTNADAFDDDPPEACAQLQKAVRIAPDDERVLGRMKKYKCQTLQK